MIRISRSGTGELLHDLSHPEDLPYQGAVLTEPKDITLARKLLASVYLRNGSIDESFVGPDHTILPEIDIYREHSVYFGVWRDDTFPSTLQDSGRLILPTADKGIDGLQIRLDELPAEWQARLRSQDPGTIAEFASLVKVRGAPTIVNLFLFKEMMEYSIDKGIETWVYGLNPALRRKYEKMFGPAMVRMGERVHLGQLKPDYIPYVIDIREARQRFVCEGETLFERLRHWHLGRRAIADFFELPRLGVTEAYPLDPETVAVASLKSSV